MGSPGGARRAGALFRAAADRRGAALLGAFRAAGVRFPFRDPPLAAAFRQTRFLAFAIVALR